MIFVQRHISCFGIRTTIRKWFLMVQQEKIKLILTRIPNYDLVWCVGGYVGLNVCFSYFGESFCFLSFYLFFFFLLVFHGSFILEAIFSSSFLSVFLSQFPKEQSDAQDLQYIIVLLLLLISSSSSLLKVLGDWAGWGEPDVDDKDGWQGGGRHL